MPAPLALVPVAGAAGSASTGAAIAYGTGFTVGTTASILAGKNPIWNKGKEIYENFFHPPMTDPAVVYIAQMNMLGIKDAFRNFDEERIQGLSSRAPAKAMTDLVKRRLSRYQFEYYMR